MTNERLERLLRRKKIERNIKRATIVIESCLAVALVGTLLSLDSNAETVIEEIKVEEIKIDNYETAVINKNSGIKASVAAGVEAALWNATFDNEEEKQISFTVDTLGDNTETTGLVGNDTVLYASANLNVRLKPDEKSARLGGLKEGDKVVVTEDIGNGWVQITYKDEPAYVCSDFLMTEAPIIPVSSTAYYNKYNRQSASMRELIEGYSIAGRVSWLNRSVNIYKCNSDGTVGDFIGTYKFDDTGYGAESGVGESKILEGRTIGTIENGTCIDFFFDTEEECVEYGRRNVYIQFVD